MSTTQISCTIGTNSPTAGLGIEVWLDNTQLLNIENVSTESMPVTWGIDDADGEHELRFILKNKTINHTAVNELGEITSDAVITISDLAFEEIELRQIFSDKATYTHDFNGTGNTVEEKFYGTMGCNGTVRLEFSTPIYMWLLESM